MKWLSNLFKGKGKYEVVYSKSGTWDISLDNAGNYNEYCHYDILHNKITNHYKLQHRGYKPEAHILYDFMFKSMRKLNEGIMVVSGGVLYDTNPKPKVNEKSVETMNETECEAYLKQALDEEDYILAEQIRKRLEELR
jgi:hypothetical protein